MHRTLSSFVFVAAMGLLLALALEAATVMPARALFTTAAPASTTVSSAVLEPPTNLKVTTDCSLFNPTATVTWTPSSSTYATGYTRSYTTNGGSSQTATGTIAATATSTTFSISILTTYTTSLTTTYRSWTSQPSASSASFLCLW